MAKQAQAVAEVKNNSLPAHLQGGKTAKIGNVDSTDRIVPRVKLLQAISPELDDHNNAKKGEFWHTVAEESLGASIQGVPILVRKSYVLWSPRNDDRGILARSNDGIHWDQPDGTEFTVQPKGSPGKVVYKLGRTVNERVDGFPALSEFGSSIPGNPNSPPAAALTYQMLWFFPEFPDLSPALVINTRSSVKAAKGLLSKIDIRPCDHFAGKYLIGVKQEQGDEGPYFNYTYTSDGYVTEEELAVTSQLFKQFKEGEWRGNDETDDVAEGSGAPNPKMGGKSDSDKF